MKASWFQLYELFSRMVYESIYPIEGERMWRLLDSRYVETIDAIRRRYGKMVANTWWWGGSHQYRGFRPIDCEVGSPLSQHKLFRAIDLVPVSESVDKIRSDIIHDRYPSDFRWITAVELDVPWLHIDGRQWDKQRNGVLRIHV